MTAGALKVANIRAGSPQRSQRVTSILNTRESRCAQVSATCRSAGVRSGGAGAGFPGTIADRHRDTAVPAYPARPPASRGLSY
jgi:hypothetical protein